MNNEQLAPDNSPPILHYIKSKKNATDIAV